MDEVELARLRRDYEAAGLAEADLPADPMVLFHEWLDCAADAALAEVNAMVLGTVGPDGRPSSRMVLCKVADAAGLRLLHQLRLAQGRRARGPPGGLPAVPLAPARPAGAGRGRRRRRSSAATSDAYFATRPRGAQLSAPGPAPSRRRSPTAPSWSSGWLSSSASTTAATSPARRTGAASGWCRGAIEFWQGRRDRLHDRLVYRRDEAASPWSVVRLSP